MYPKALAGLTLVAIAGCGTGRAVPAEASETDARDANDASDTRASDANADAGCVPPDGLACCPGEDICAWIDQCGGCEACQYCQGGGWVDDSDDCYFKCMALADTGSFTPVDADAGRDAPEPLDGGD